MLQLTLEYVTNDPYYGAIVTFYSPFRIINYFKINHFIYPQPRGVARQEVIFDFDVTYGNN